MKASAIWFYLLVISLALGACVARAEPAGSTPLASAPQNTQAMATFHIPAATLASTATQKPSATPLPSATPTPTPLACWQQGGRYEEGSLRSDLLPLPMEYRVYLPPCYDQQGDRRYPVLYLIHGQNYNHDQWDRLGVDEAADRLIAAGEIPPLLIVLPHDRSWAMPTEDRFGQVLVEGLVPTIDSNYRTLPERPYRAVGGLSRGAGWAVNLGLSRWELFGAIGGHSLPVFWTDTAYIRQWLKDIPPDELPRIYLDIGENDRPQILNSASWFENLLTEERIPHEWHLFPGYHEEAYWQSHLEQYLRWYTQGW